MHPRAFPKGKEAVSRRRDVREALNVGDSTVRSWLTELVELDYLEAVDGGGHGKTVRYRLTGRGSAEATRSRWVFSVPRSSGRNWPKDEKVRKFAEVRQWGLRGLNR